MKIIKTLFLALFLLAATFNPAARAAAQGGSTGTLILSGPETAFFPTMRFRLDAYDARGHFIDSLQPDGVQITEDGRPLKPQSVEKAQNGLQVIFVLNVGPVMARQFNGVTGYQVIQKALTDWARSQPANKPAAARDDFSLATPTGLFVIREHDPQAAVKGFADYQPDLAHAQPALGSLAEALDLATDPLDQPTMKRVILYITPPLPASNNETLTDLSRRAQSEGVRVNIWQLVEANAKAAPQNAASPFEQMAAATGGSFQEVNLASPLPEIEPLFQPLRQYYQVLYTSAIRKSGSHSLSVQINPLGEPLASTGGAASAGSAASTGSAVPKGSPITDGSGKSAGNAVPMGVATSNESTFNLTVEPPNPIFLSPPSSVQRYWSTPAKTETASLSPEKVELQIMVEFPDQHRRPLKATRLYVDGKMVAENTSEPFDRFDWLLNNLTTPARPMLRVEAVDSLDLTGTSSDIPVEILVDQPARAAITERVSTQGMVAVGAVAAAGVVLALVLVFTSTQRRARSKRQQADKRRMKDPVTQPVIIRQDHSRPSKSRPGAKPAGTRVSSAWSNPIWTRNTGLGSRDAASAAARLVALDENEQPITGGAIALTRQEITFGTNPQRATQVLDSPTVNELHARLYRAPDGSFYLADQGSIAGTWINFAPVTSSGARLEHGDLIHIGRVMFRFELAAPPQVEVKVTDLEQSR